MAEPDHAALVLDGSDLSVAELARAARDPRVPVELSEGARRRIEHCHRLITGIAERYQAAWERRSQGDADERPVQDYGVTTGFGEFKDIPIAPRELEDLQRNILLSHTAGAGVSADSTDLSSYYPAEVVRAVLLMRLNTFAKGHSGLSLRLTEAVLRMVQRGIVPLVPIHGSVGSSGDLCPLSHLFVVLLGESRYRRVRSPEDLAHGATEIRAAGDHLAEDMGFEPPSPSFKEGLALVNGATFSAALLALAVVEAEDLAASADLAAGLSAEAFQGCARAFDPKVHDARGQRGQIDSAANIRAAVAGSHLLEGEGAVQDPYSVRCAPVVHGASRDAIAYARRVAEREINAATDNPLFFPGEDGGAHSQAPFDAEFADNWPEGYDGGARASYSAGNFHGQPIALAADFLAIALAEIGNISERRCQLLLDSKHNRGLPPNLIPRPGVNSGLMIIQYCAAGLVSENKGLAHPASVDSIPTSANSEDHNSMATIAGRKLRTLLRNVQATLAIELLVAAQAVEWRVALRGLGEARERQEITHQVEELASAFEAQTSEAGRATVAERLGRGSRQTYRAIRQAAPPMLADRPLEDDLREVRALLESGSLPRTVLRDLGDAWRDVADC